MQIIKSSREMQKFADAKRKEGKRIGLVPTMGYLHEGHLSLIRKARQKCDVLVVSIFVNPTQFGPQEDFESYPRDFKKDSELCEKEQVDVIFNPSNTEMYPRPFLSSIAIKELTDTMCGLSRPGHFEGVAAAVAKLFNIVKPHLAVFGQKDYQQSLVIRQFTRDLNFDVEILTAPTVRETDGLAMSSRNTYLSQKERQEALVIPKSLTLAEDMIRDGVTSPAMVQMQMEQTIRKASSAAIDYIAIVDAATLRPISCLGDGTLIAVAVKIGNTRLIDNTIINIKN